MRGSVRSEDQPEISVVAVPGSSDLRAQIFALEGLDNAALRKAWQKTWKRAPPKGARKRFLMRGIAWRWQADLFGGFGPELSRRLAVLETRRPIGGANDEAGIADVASAARPTPGSRLIRDWRGERYEVHVTEIGYFWRGQTYGSLSAIAKAITGVSQNGPRFFGLRHKRRAG